jgi:hypothetical protein
MSHRLAGALLNPAETKEILGDSRSLSQTQKKASRDGEALSSKGFLKAFRVR